LLSRDRDHRSRGRAMLQVVYRVVDLAVVVMILSALT
jgi:hypothetical protein